MFRHHWEQLVRVRQEQSDMKRPIRTVSRRADGMPVEAVIGYVASHEGTWSASEPLPLWEAWTLGNTEIMPRMSGQVVAVPTTADRMFWVTSAREDGTRQAPPIDQARLIESIRVAHPVAGEPSWVRHAVWLDARESRRFEEGGGGMGMAVEAARKELDRT
jgi:hypothetical protein